MEAKPDFNGNSREVSQTPDKGGFKEKTLLVPLDNNVVSEKKIIEADAWVSTWSVKSLSCMSSIPITVGTKKKSHSLKNVSKKLLKHVK